MNATVIAWRGFVGSVVRILIADSAEVANLDKLTFAGILEFLPSGTDNLRYHFVHPDICGGVRAPALLDAEMPDAVVRLTPESHIDRAIDGSSTSMKSEGEGALPDRALAYWRLMAADRKARAQLHQVSTNEVNGSQGEIGPFREVSPYASNSPILASKAGGYNPLRDWFHTSGFLALITDCSNKYGPVHFREKPIPLSSMIEAWWGRILSGIYRGEWRGLVTV